MRTEFHFGEEICVARTGVYPNPQAGVDQVIDAPALNTMAAAGSARIANGGGDILVDFDHDSQDLKKSSVAAGWGTELRVDGGRLLMKVRWSDLGSAALSNGRFRYVSPVFDRLEKLDGNRVRPIELHSVALTNSPVMRDLGPVANRLTKEARILNRGEALSFAAGPGADLPELDVAREVGAFVQVLCNRERAALKCDFERAWSNITTLHPELMFLMQNPARVETSLRNRGGPERSMRAMRRFQVLVNRAATTQALSDAEAQQFVREREPKAYEKMNAFHERELLNIPVHLTPEEVSRQVSQALRSIKLAMPGASFEEIWEAFKTQKTAQFALLLAVTE